MQGPERRASTMALLPRVTGVLARAVTPIATSTSGLSTGTPTDSKFQREKPVAVAAPELEPQQAIAPAPQLALRVIKREELETADVDVRERGTTPSKNAAPLSPPERKLTVVPSDPAAEDAQALQSAPAVPADTTSPAQRLIEMFKSFSQGATLVRWVGSQTYKSLSKESRKGKFRRGAMLDEEIE